MWENFQNEVEKARRATAREYTFTDRDYVERSNELAGVESESAYVSDIDSYLNDIDFNALFEKKRHEISDSVNQQIEKIRLAGLDLPEDTLEELRQKLAEKEVQKAAEYIDPELIEKRPHQARKLMRDILKTRTQDAVSNLLIDNGIGEKSSELYPIFSRYMPYLKTTEANDAILVRYVFLKLAKAYGPVDKRDNKALLQSINDLDKVLAEVERMIK